MLNTDNMNLGFSGAAKGEQSVAEYIAASDISAFVMDYDHNNTVAGLRDTHYAFYETVRAAHPDIPIIMVSRPIFESECTDEQIERQEIIRASYDRAVDSGDKNVYFRDGFDALGELDAADATADGTHPTDLGFMNMARQLYPLLKKLLSE
jgi:lysophospholipase L1-like esterase